MPQSQRPIEYTVTLNAPQTQTFEVGMRVRNIAAASINLALPVWRAGRYAILNPAGTLSQLRAESAHGKNLPVAKLDKTTWQVQTEGCTELSVRYTVYAS